MHKENSHSVHLENMKREVRRPRGLREEKFKNGVGERSCKLVDLIMCLA